MIGAYFKEWKIEELLGEGSFGKVYRITRQEFGYTYQAALKVIEIPQSNAELQAIRNEVSSEEEVEEYFQSVIEDIVKEFVLMTRLKGNTNIVGYEDHAVIKNKDKYGWTVYIRMELLTSLMKYVKNADLSNRDVIQMGIDICKALEVCKQYNIIHRDIKPDNIFVSDLGNYKLGDFGIARELEKTSGGLSQKGTRNYMAPEMFRGNRYNATVDLYSLGIVMYRFLNNNRLPFYPPYPEKIRYSDKEEAENRRISGEKLPMPVNASPELAAVILKACAFDPKERYENATQMREALEAVLEAEKEDRILFHATESVNPKPQPQPEQAPQSNPEEDETVLSINSIDAGTNTEDSALEETVEQVEISFEENFATETHGEEVRETDEQQDNTQEEGTVILMKKEEDTVCIIPEERNADDPVDSVEEVDEKQQLNRQLNKKIAIIGGALFVVILILVILFAVSFMSKGKNGGKETDAEPPVATDQIKETATVEPTKVPTEAPTEKPTEKPTAKPTKKPTKKKVKKATEKPKVTAAPTRAPVVHITEQPVRQPEVHVTQRPVRNTPRAEDPFVGREDLDTEEDDPFEGY